ncbi:AI-2E family transporter [Streptomyces sp. RB6PN25]|uniref:AI-2E family transporter n=1 Tax=Streptomyces humicola TaxID=2953240 RepID=A0ABT1PXA0_9ACTN|nr:AI-2E family transporter [Streptomyces humicola]MCQ4082269.1 AI-2E family transporter [Streptomyces humicola]
MSQKQPDRPGFSGWLAAFAGRLGERRAEADADRAASADPAGGADGDVAGHVPGDAGQRPVDHVPAPPDYAPAVAAPRAPVEAVPWGVRVAAEVGWRLLVLAAALYVLMRVISAVELVVLSFVAALLITALLQPTVSRLKRAGVPRGLATALTFIGGFVVMGLVGWFVVWQVMENTDTLSSRLQDGVIELKKSLLNSPLHVTEAQLNQITKNLNNAIGTNADQITSAGLQGVTVVIEMFTGMFLAMFSTLFLLYDGRNVWNWVLKLFPREAREGIAGAGPRAWRTLTLYVRGTVVVAFIDAVCIGVGIYLLGVPMAVPLAVVIFLGAFIPLVGAVVTGALAMIVALVTNGPFTMLMVLLVVLAVQQIEGHVLQPFILGRAVRVHPLAVVLSVTAGSLIGSIGGAVVAVPLVAVANTVVGYLRAHGREAALRRSHGPHGTTAVVTAPVRAPGEPLTAEE